MGNRNHGPNTEKKTIEGKTSMFSYACCEMQGWRDSMVSLYINLQTDLTLLYDNVFIHIPVMFYSL